MKSKFYKEFKADVSKLSNIDNDAKQVQIQAFNYELLPLNKMSDEDYQNILNAVLNNLRRV